MKKAIRIEVWNKYSKKCAYCGIDLEYKDMQVDHIHPKLHGGRDDFKNLNPSCRMCNFYKSTHTLEQFRTQIGKILSRLERNFIYRLSKRYGLVLEESKKIEFYFEKV